LAGIGFGHCLLVVRKVVGVDLPGAIDVGQSAPPGLFLFRNLLNMTDRELYKLCKKFGARALSARRRFAGLLPEVNRRDILEKSAGRSWLLRRGFTCIYEFAARLAGMSREQVDTVLRLEKKFEAMPVLKAALVSGEVSPNKLIRIASVATVDNQVEIVEKVKLLPQKALEIWVREERAGQVVGGCSGSGAEKIVGLFGADCGGRAGESVGEFGVMDVVAKPLFDVKSLRAQTLKLDEDVEDSLIAMQEKGIDVNAFLRECLKRRADEIEAEKVRIVEESAGVGGFGGNTVGESVNVGVVVAETVGAAGAKPSRHVPVKIKRLIQKEHGDKCSMPNCFRRAKILHHTLRFAMAGRHDPRYLAPLCEGHHALAHLVDVRVAGRR
jgi:hypothetical protein